LSVTGVVAALEFEARCLSRLSDGSLIGISGIGADNAARAARALIAGGAGALLSWGVAGALEPALECGAAVLPCQVLRQPGAADGPTLQRFDTCRAWRERVRSALQGHVRVVDGALLSSAAPVAAAHGKASLFRDTGAVAVDMESAAVAAVAAAHGLPFIALRVILDTASDSLPASVMRAFDPARARPARCSRAWALMAAPQDWGSLLRLAARYRCARRGLRDCCRHGDPTRAGDAPAGR
jgi:adenosylhomocysteine nucleosidase